MLVIVESPAKAKTIEKFLGRRYTVKASIGHVRDLPKSQFGVDVEKDFEPKYIAIRGKGDIIKELRQAAKGADRVLLAADPDREGEAIAWHLQHLLNLEPDEPCRIEFNEITQQAIRHAVQAPRTIDQDRVDAQQARRVLDRVVGYNLSPLLWRKIRRGLSAGRVQSVAVRLICDREQEIRAFVPEEYWTLTGQFQADKGAGSRFSAKLISVNGDKITIPNQEEMEKVLRGLEDAQYRVAQIKKRQTRRNPAPPFTTSTLQQEAYRKLNFTARRTMRVAQQLYEGLALGKEGIVGLISYIRTDSTRVSPEIQQQARAFIAQKYGAEFVSPQPRLYASAKKAQDAHESIRPTAVLREPDSVKDLLTSEQFRLYRLIWERFVASQMSSAVLDQTRIDIAGAGKAREMALDKNLKEAAVYGFRANGSIIRFPGFMQVYVEDRDDESKEGTALLPELTEGQSLKAVKLEDKQHFTQPPPRYGEATLVKTLEEKGIGRPSTYAPTIETIVSRGYVLRQEKQFVPTELGFLVVDMLKQYFPDIIDLEFTAELEEKLDQVEEGQFPWKQLIREFYFPFKETLDYADAQIGRVELTDEESEEPCPKCGRLMVIKRGPFGRFLACPGFPECQTTRPILEEIGVECPRCGGQIVVRHSKKGRKFYGCSKFPECNFVAWQQPTREKCPQCGDLLMEKAARGKEKYLVCTNSECGYRPDGQPPAKRRAKAAAADSESKTNLKSKSKTKTKAASSRKNTAKTSAESEAKTETKSAVKTAAKTRTKASPKSTAKNTVLAAEKTNAKGRVKKPAGEVESKAGSKEPASKKDSKEPTGKTKTTAATKKVKTSPPA